MPNEKTASISIEEIYAAACPACKRKIAQLYGETLLKQAPAKAP